MDYPKLLYMKNLIFLFALSLILNSNISGQIKQFRNNLYIIDPNGNAILMDGTLSLYSNDYSNDVDRLDARKMFNPGENIGIQRDNKVLIIERRKDIEVSDTIFFKLWNTREITYRLELLCKNFVGNNIKAVLYDNYLKTQTNLSLTEDNFYDFEVTTDSESKRTDRFMIVFNPVEVEASVMPLNFISSTLTIKANTVSVLWETANEQNVKKYTIERSLDGIHFELTGIEVDAYNKQYNNYGVEDMTPAKGLSYYRIVAHDFDGKITMSKIMKVSISSLNATVSVFPNPAVSSNIRLRFEGHEQGTYKISMVNGFGSIVYTQTENLTSNLNQIKLSTSQPMAPGIYRIEVIGPNGYYAVRNLLIAK